MVVPAWVHQSDRSTTSPSPTCPRSKERLYRNGARLDATYALPPTFRGQALNFGVVNDADSAHFAAVGCAGTVPGVDRVVAHLETSLKDLERSVGL